MKPIKCLPSVLLAILLCLTISCITPVDPDRDQTTADSEEGAGSGGEEKAPSKRAMTSQGPRSYTLTGPCERVFLEHPREEVSVKEGKGTYYCPPDAAPGVPALPGFSRIVEENVPYKFVVADGDMLTFTATTLPQS